MRKNLSLIAICLALIGSLFISSYALAAADSTASSGDSSARPGHFGGPRGTENSENRQQNWGTFGTITAINGTTLTIESQKFTPRSKTVSTDSDSKNTTPAAPEKITYTVDTSGATFKKDGQDSTLSAFSVGDQIMIQGTITDNSIVAKTIISNSFKNGPHSGNKDNSNLPISGDGQPVIGGTLTAINGSTLTLTNTGKLTYTIDASAASIVKDNATTSLSSLIVNDNVVIQGSINGTSITATSVIDNGTPQTASSDSAPRENFINRIFGGIGNLFHSVFGFFK